MAKNRVPLKTIRPFANGSEYVAWISYNCNQVPPCRKYNEDESGHCELRDALDDEDLDNGEIPADIAYRLGFLTADGLRRKNKRCREYETKPNRFEDRPPTLDEIWSMIGDMTDLKERIEEGQEACLKAAGWDQKWVPGPGGETVDLWGKTLNGLMVYVPAVHAVFLEGQLREQEQRKPTKE